MTRYSKSDLIDPFTTLLDLLPFRPFTFYPYTFIINQAFIISRWLKWRLIADRFRPAYYTTHFDLYLMLAGNNFNSVGSTGNSLLYRGPSHPITSGSIL